MNQQHIGNDFSTKITLNLFPFITFSRGSYHIQLSYVCIDGYQVTSMNAMSMFSDGRDLNFVFGRDVVEVSVLIQNPNMDAPYYSYSLRLDRLMLLNTAHKLLR